MLRIAVEEVDIANSGATVADLRRQLAGRGEAAATTFSGGRPVRVAVDRVMRSDACLLNDGCEVAFFPTVTGG
ncbi:MoaD/ThiS family protein [Paraburkholderia sp. MM5384-R2]|uniref:MoaD/ThiS family protein n=1 Tax=Paraburkholderia sp. MM5384-R2 TaxID=2723097 RepID=UPI00161C1AF3|nr:MoaD/ThiS family protein [Paraburkholderia sp. MM5384-R2]